MGKITSLRLDFSNRNEKKTAYAAYVGFFPTEEMAIAYAGEMPHDQDAQSIIDAIEDAYENDELDIDYESGATEASANEYVEELIESVTADAVAAIEDKGVQNISLTITDTKYAPSENYWEDGSYTFTVKLLIGDKIFRRSVMEKTYNVALKAKTMGVVFIPDTFAAIGSTVTFNPIIADDYTATAYQWYTCDDTNGTNSVAIEDATSATYTTPNLDNLGSYYYKVVVNGEEEAVVAVSVGMPTEPVVFMFNNEYDLANWSANTDTKRIVNVDGKTAFAYTAWSNDAHTSFKNLDQYNDF